MYAVEMTSCGMTYIPSFMKSGEGVQALLKFSSAIWIAAMLVLLIEEIYEVRCWNGFMCGDTRAKFHEYWYSR
jgi:hypothetical protein